MMQSNAAYGTRPSMGRVLLAPFTVHEVKVRSTLLLDTRLMLMVFGTSTGPLVSLNRNDTRPFTAASLLVLLTAATQLLVRACVLFGSHNAPFEQACCGIQQVYSVITEMLCNPNTSCNRCLQDM